MLIDNNSSMHVLVSKNSSVVVMYSYGIIICVNPKTAFAVQLL